MNYRVAVKSMGILGTAIAALFLIGNSCGFAASSVVAWLGTGGQALTNVPPSLTNIVSIAAGGAALALRESGLVVAWGSGPATNVPPGLSNVVAVAAGGSHALVLLEDGTLRAWGAGSSGQTNIPPDLTNVVAIASGDAHNVVLKSDGTVVAWGANYGSQTNVPAGLSNVVAVSCGYATSYALKSNGSIVGWGSSVASRIPTTTNAVAVDGSAATGVAVLGDGSIAPWGFSGETNFPPGLSKVIAVASYAPFNQVGGSWALRRDGTLAGSGPFLGDTNVWQNLSNVVAIASGYYLHLALIDTEPARRSGVLSSASYSNGIFRVTHMTLRGRSYYLEYKTALDTNYWFMLPPLPGDAAEQIFTDPAVTDSARFYQIRSHP